MTLFLSLVLFDAASIRAKLFTDQDELLGDLVEFFNEELDGDPRATPETVVDLIENQVGAPVYIGEVDDPPGNSTTDG